MRAGQPAWQVRALVIIPNGRRLRALRTRNCPSWAARAPRFRHPVVDVDLVSP